MIIATLVLSFSLMLWQQKYYNPQNNVLVMISTLRTKKKMISTFQNICKSNINLGNYGKLPVALSLSLSGLFTGLWGIFLVNVFFSSSIDAAMLKQEVP